ncbi:MAG TPA: ribonuclease H [Acidimicrobiales bacterium]|nr:ribonuclease H [Acidimicrobiales bacterium]
MPCWSVLTVYTDGACIGNPGPGGWAWLVPEGQFASGAEPETTNNRMELTAVLEALRALPGPLEVVSDSQYVVNCFKERWYEKWEAKGWRTKGGEDRLNRDLWQPLVQLVRERKGQVTFKWVRGHADDPQNDLVDRLANEAARAQVGRAGRGVPDDLGPPDEPGRAQPSRTGAVLQKLSGWHLVVMGHRAPGLGGYDPSNPTASRVRRKIVEVVEGIYAVHPDVVVLTGLGLGAEMLGAEAAQVVGVPYVAALPYPNPDSVWPDPTRERYRGLIAGAQRTLMLSERPPKTRQQAGIAVGRGNSALIASAHGAVVVWDGTDTGIGRTVDRLERLIPDDLWIVAPN